MLRKTFPLLLLLGFLSCGIATEQEPAANTNVSQPVAQKENTDKTFRDGDVIFQSSKSGQSLAIQMATHSKYSHCGMVFWVDGKCMVYEAMQPIKLTPVQEFINRGDDHHYVVKRLKDSTTLAKSTTQKLWQVCKSYDGKNYDLYFDWSDEKIYCSELVWKSYHNGIGVDLAKPMKMKEFDLSNPVVKAKLKERYGNEIPLEQPVISPSQLFDSELLMEAFRE